jgi:hypothetical protein
MMGLNRELVDHRLPIKKGFKLYKQPARNYNSVLYDRIKEEVECLLEVGFVQTCMYAEWVSNIFLVEKKNTSKIRVCIYFQNLNRATPIDKYPMPVADASINSASSNKIISFLDGSAGYNQIFMA